MIDHLLGQSPAPSSKRLHVLGSAVFWALVVLLSRGRKARLPAWLHVLDRRVAGCVRPWQIIIVTLNMVHVVKNLDQIFGLGCAEPLTYMYSRSFYRATWLLTALDAGFWTAMTIRPMVLRRVAECVFSLYYLVFAADADIKTQKIKSMATVDHIRCSWEKSTTPVLRALTLLSLPAIETKRRILINRDGGRAPVECMLYYDGSPLSLRSQRHLVLHLPGGGFIAMPPSCHEDCILPWARKLKIPLLSVNYVKAPEQAYPYQIHECIDVYRALRRTAGACVGIEDRTLEKIALIGDSAGGNFATGVTLDSLESKGTIAPPDGLVLVYPFLDFNINTWMSSEHLRLVWNESKNELSRNSLMERKTSRRWMQADDNNPQRLASDGDPTSASEGRHPLVMTSRVTYYQDRIISPDMMRLMAMAYVGNNPRSEVSSDYMLSPLLAPMSLLERFPRTYILCGEVDPFVDDSLIFTGRIRQAKSSRNPAGADGQVVLELLRGASHGFLSMTGILPEGRRARARCRAWLATLLEDDTTTVDDESGSDESLFMGSSWPPQSSSVKHVHAQISPPWSPRMTPSPGADPMEEQTRQRWESKMLMGQQEALTRRSAKLLQNHLAYVKSEGTG